MSDAMKQAEALLTIALDTYAQEIRWEILAAARWAVVALLQGERHITGGEPSIELLLTGLMAPEMEHEALQGIQALET